MLSLSKCHGDMWSASECFAFWTRARAHVTWLDLWVDLISGSGVGSRSRFSAGLEWRLGSFFLTFGVGVGVDLAKSFEVGVVWDRPRLITAHNTKVGGKFCSNYGIHIGHIISCQKIIFFNKFFFPPLWFTNNIQFKLFEIESIKYLSINCGVDIVNVVHIDVRPASCLADCREKIFIRVVICTEEIRGFLFMNTVVFGTDDTCRFQQLQNILHRNDNLNSSFRFRAVLPGSLNDRVLEI